jgi:hypothetical protein
MTVSYQNAVIMQGRQVQSTGLWHFDLSHHNGHENCSPVPLRSICENTKGESISILPRTPLHKLFTSGYRTSDLPYSNQYSKTCQCGSLPPCCPLLSCPLYLGTGNPERIPTSFPWTHPLSLALSSPTFSGNYQGPSGPDSQDPLVHQESAKGISNNTCF